MSNPFSKKQFLDLVKKYISGKTNPEEENFLHNYYDYFENKTDGLSDLSKTELMEMKDQMKNSIWSATALTNPVIGKMGLVFFITQNIKKTVAAAAIFIGIITVSVLWVLSKQQATKSDNTQQLAKQHNSNIKIQPGTDKAILTISDGRIITLDSAGNGIVATQSNTVISNNNNQLVYCNDKKIDLNSIPLFNTISTPMGGQYQVLLSDGTKVWLNASSSLSFPVNFYGGERKVELTGEAYFEVAKNKASPFIVKVRDMDVKVLGTHFNIMSYTDEDRIATTLLEGSVSVSKGADSRMMVPGEQLRYYNKGVVEMKSNVDVEQVVAWKNGKFHFDEADIKTIMRQLGRWYNIDVVYEGKAPETLFGGIIGKKENINQLLKIFELTGRVHFKIEGTKITIKK